MTENNYLCSKADESRLNVPHGTENKNERNKEEKSNTKTYMLRRNDQVKSVEEVPKEEKSLWWEGVVKQVGFKLEVKE